VCVQVDSRISDLDLQFDILNKVYDELFASTLSSLDKPDALCASTQTALGQSDCSLAGRWVLPLAPLEAPPPGPVWGDALSDDWSHDFSDGP
jgi:hypothetical protein